MACDFNDTLECIFRQCFVDEKQNICIYNHAFFLSLSAAFIFIHCSSARSCKNIERDSDSADEVITEKKPWQCGVHLLMKSAPILFMSLGIKVSE